MVIYPLSPQGPLQDIKHRISVASTSFTNVNYHVLCLCHDMSKKNGISLLLKFQPVVFSLLGSPKMLSRQG